MAESDFLKQVVSGIRMSAKKQQETFHNTKHNIVVPVASGGGVDENESTDIEYKISVYTGDIPNASTSAKVFITLYSADGTTSGFVMLDEENAIDVGKSELFTRGQRDEFKVKSANLRHIDRVRIGHDGTGAGAGWYLNKVVVTDPITKMEFEFNADRWLSTYDDDRQLVTDIEVSHEHSLTGRDFQADASESFDVDHDPDSKYPTVKCKDYSPKVFRNIREMYGIHTDEYITSWTLPDEKLVAEEGAGRSGSLFLISSDNKYMLKTIPADEVNTLMSCLHNYYQHLVDYKTSLIMKIFGVMHFTCKGHDMHVMIFTNVCYFPHGEMCATYDLKGRVPKPGKALQNTAKIGTSYIFKDKDLDRKFFVRLDEKSSFFTQLNRDIEFFRLNNLMDYSLLIGVATMPEDNIDYPEWQYIARSSPSKGEIYFIGFIDCLTNYGMRKKAANFFKTALWTPNTLSTIDATSYAERIKYYLFDIFDATGDEAPPALTRAARANTNTGLGGDDNILLEKKVSFLETKVYKLEEQLQAASTLLMQVLQEKNIDVPADLIPVSSSKAIIQVSSLVPDQ